MQTVTHLFTDDGLIPNSPYPVILYKKAIPDAEAADFEQLFLANSWGDSWRNGIFPYHHYHSSAHEVLGVFRGWSLVQLGGQQGESFRVEQGDVVILPAGTGHKNLEQSPDFGVVGAYPEGQHPDMNYGKLSEREKSLENIRKLALPSADPIGEQGSLIQRWKEYSHHEQT
ncbi:MAG: hypothetical protein ACQEQU_09310 [Spirochaetota bacterium]